ncbi:O-antigen translocase [Pseudomonas sp. CCC3.2]|uniref:O-antigen translocase n=1 Tax=unclassified Pseudomonas TaxID=196821 RepID=UPI002AB57ED7|nr:MULTISPECIES: O-antigen translocase [unclassified Pseudomonas]MDY7561399.1 O-antigen translocase [Pseudomonas sp. AB6]MEB0178931.1 O-antigen translocase [Pseudomonas sp. CCC3.2]MEB0210195.1 O-antigen translocase [Pseudomonas sp. AB6]
MNLLKTGGLTAIATFARLLSGFLVMKLVALFAGPEGVAQLGQFMSLTALLVVFAGGGVGPGVVKYIAELKDNDEQLKRLLNAAVCFTIIASLAMCVGVLIFNKNITVWLLGDVQYSSLVVVLAFAQFFIAFNNLILAIVNGMMDVKRLALIHVCGAVVGVMAPIILGYYFKLYGVLLAFLLAQALLVVVSFFCYKRSHYFSWSYLRPAIDKMVFKKLSKYSLMTLTSALLFPVVQILVRNILADRFSWEQVGYWQAVSKVSEAYLMFITMAISVYYLPKLSAINERNEFKNEIKLGYLYLMPVVIISALLIFMLKELITWILFSADFSGALYLYAPQLIGDVLKIASFVLSYIMLAKAMTKTFFLSELMFSGMYLGWVWIMTGMFGLIGAMYAFIINYSIYLIFTVVVARLYIRNM